MLGILTSESTQIKFVFKISYQVIITYLVHVKHIHVAPSDLWHQITDSCLQCILITFEADDLTRFAIYITVASLTVVLYIAFISQRNVKPIVND